MKVCLARIAQISYFIVTYQCTEDFSFSLYFMTVGVFFSLISVPAQDCGFRSRNVHFLMGFFGFFLVLYLDLYFALFCFFCIFLYFFSILRIFLYFLCFSITVYVYFCFARLEELMLVLTIIDERDFRQYFHFFAKLFLMKDFVFSVISTFFDVFGRASIYLMISVEPVSTYLFSLVFFWGFIFLRIDIYFSWATSRVSIYFLLVSGSRVGIYFLM